MKLFESGKIGKLSIKNRIIMAPMGIGALAEPDGRLSRRAIDYYVARAKGGAGLITTGLTCVDSKIEVKAEDGLGMLTRLDSPIHIGPLSELVDAVHDYGAKLSVQLTAGMGRVIFGDTLRKGLAVAPSPLPCFWNPRIMARELTTEEVEKLVRAFGVSAAYAKAAGVDAIELHGHEGYLLDQFQSEIWNVRTDKFGGDFERRLRFPLEVIQRIKSRSGGDLPLIYRYGITHYLDGGRGIEESLKMAKRFEESGIDALHVDAGCYETWYWAHPPVYQHKGCMVNLAEMVKKMVRIPVIAVGKLGYPGLAEEVLQQNKADFICLGRALLADPEWPNKVKEGKIDDIRPCIGDHAGCLDRVFSGKYISCAVNPRTGLERRLALNLAPKSKSVLVIGAGPAGMEAAIVAAQRGHGVSLWEKDFQLGGNLIPASVPEFKKDLKDFNRYMSRKINKLRVDLRLGRDATAKMVKEANPDVVIIATGGSFIIPKIPGINRYNVFTAVDLLLGRKKAGEKVLVLGGGVIGCETGIHLAQKGRKVTIVEALQTVFRGTNKANNQQMLRMIGEHNVEVLLNTNVQEITDRGVLVTHANKEVEMEVDTIVIAVGLCAKANLYNELEGEVAELHAIGDCIKPGMVLEAIWGGHRVAHLI